MSRESITNVQTVPPASPAEGDRPSPKLPRGHASSVKVWPVYRVPLLYPVGCDQTSPKDKDNIVELRRQREAYLYRTRTVPILMKSIIPILSRQHVRRRD